MSGIELAAVLLGVAYLLLAMRESLWCWYAALVSTALFLYLFWQVNLLMESALRPLRNHLIATSLVLLAALISGTLLAQNTDAALPYLDSFTTWGSIVTTWMVARKILENWLYWLVIDSASIYLYLDRELYLTAALFAVYVVIVIFGYFQWLQHYRARSS
jgi:nicotinamide mononucleotide transporter